MLRVRLRECEAAGGAGGRSTGPAVFGPCEDASIRSLDFTREHGIQTQNTRLDPLFYSNQGLLPR